MKNSCSVDGCNSPVKARGFCNKHYKKVVAHGDALYGYEEKSAKGSGSIRQGGYHRRSIDGKEKLQHVLIAEKAIGKLLPKGTYVHHADGNPLNNSNNNLVVCPNQSYHKLLHQRQDAMTATGHADWRTCNRCHKYDDPKNMYVSSNFSTTYHRACEAEYARNRRAAQSK